MRSADLSTLASALLLASGSFLAVAASWPYCSSPIFCPGDILKAVQLAKLYPDSKTFVDKPTKNPLQQVLASFNALGPSPSRESLASWVTANFNEEGQDLVPASLRDFKERVAFIDRIKDPVLRGFAQSVHGFWPNLTRTVNHTALCDGCVSSLIPVNRSFIVPGGRFREFYYWDTYFVMQGILLSELYETAKNIILNFLDLVDEFGFMPNGARIYYLNRSQPPFLVRMVKIYYEKTGDNELLDRALPTLEKELEFWRGNTTVKVTYAGRSHILNHYNVNNSSPRPESYYEDYNTVENGTSFTEAERLSLYSDLAAGAETGWDYSSRWMRDPLASDLRSLNTRAVVPVELNAILYASETTMGDFYKLRKGDISKAHEYYDRAEKRRKAMEDVMWDNDAGSFFDFNLTSGQRSSEFALSNYFPFWAGAIPDAIVNDRSKLEAVFDNVKELLNKYSGILPTTLVQTTQQWDFPNGWPPLQYIVIRALLENHRTLESDRRYHRARRIVYSGALLDTARELSQRVIDSAFCGWVQTGGSLPGILPKQTNTTDVGHMFEKFNVTVVGLAGGGGEYVVQTGFGWTNGIVLWIMDKFGEDLRAPECAMVNIN